jgi:hypothetical protein
MVAKAKWAQIKANISKSSLRISNNHQKETEADEALSKFESVTVEEKRTNTNLVIKVFLRKSNH